MEEGRSGHSGTTNKGPTYRLLPSTQTPHSHYLPLPLLHPFLSLHSLSCTTQPSLSLHSLPLMHYTPLPLTALPFLSLHSLPLTTQPSLSLYSLSLHTPPSHYTPSLSLHTLPLTTHPPSHYTPSLPPPYRDPPHSKGGNRTLSCLCTEFQGTAQQTRKSWLIHKSRAACNKQTLAAYNGWLVRTVGL